MSKKIDISVEAGSAADLRVKTSYDGSEEVLDLPAVLGQGEGEVDFQNPSSTEVVTAPASENVTGTMAQVTALLTLLGSSPIILELIRSGDMSKATASLFAMIERFLPWGFGLLIAWLAYKIVMKSWKQFTFGKVLDAKVAGKSMEIAPGSEPKSIFQKINPFGG